MSDERHPPDPGVTLGVDDPRGSPMSEDSDLSAELARAKIRRSLFESSDAPPRIGRFVVLRVLGQGGMGRVFAGFDEQLDRRVTIKVLRRSVTESARQRVRREAKAMAKLSHPNVVQVFEVGEHDGSLYIAMEYVRGTTLEEWQQPSNQRPWTQVLDAYLQAGEGLASAHRVGLIHRDFKPQNVMIEDGDDGRFRVRVLDFGLARLHHDSASGEAKLLDAELLESAAKHREALRVREVVLGPNHPAVAMTVNNLAEVLESQARFDEALEGYERALAIFEKAGGPDHPNAAHVRHSIASFLLQRGRPRDAEPFARRALQARRAAFGSDHEAVTEARETLAAIERELRREAPVSGP